MKFKIENKGEIPLYSTTVDLKERWSVITPERLERDIGGKWTWFKGATDPEINKLRRRERTRLYLGYDGIVQRPVIVKVLQYSLEDLNSEHSVNKKREVLTAQIELLNDILSPLLPEPLDWFEIKNTVDSFPNDKLSNNEPVLVLDYQPGITLESTINRKRFRRQDDEAESINIERVGRLISYIKYFLSIVYDKGYMYIGLSPEHILLLKDDVPRFIGLGSICKLKDGKLDHNHINFGRTTKGYSAPELNSVEYNFGIGADAKAAGAFSLGVLLAQILCESTKLTDNVLENGSFKYPNDEYETKIKALRKGERIHYLLTRLCDPNPSTRLTDFDEIESILEELKGDKQLESFGIKGNLGQVKFFANDKGFGYITDPYFNEDYYISAKILEKSGVTYLYEGQRVKFDIINGRDKPYAANISILSPGETVISKRQEQEMKRKQKQEEKRRQEADRQRLEDQKRRQNQEEARRRQEAQRRKQEEQRRLEEERRRQEEIEEKKRKAKMALVKIANVTEKVTGAIEKRTEKALDSLFNRSKNK